MDNAFFSVVLLVLCGTVFVTSPAGLLDKLTPDRMNGTFRMIVILAYYLLATLLPIDKLIGRLYPVFGVMLIVMACGVIGGILFSGGQYIIPEISFQDLHPKGTPIWPYMLYILMASEGFRLDQTVSYIAGAVAATILFVIYMIKLLHSLKGKKKIQI